MGEDVLELFRESTKTWFAQELGNPTAVQREAWPAIAAGEHTLVSAPTGTGKTLSAFLVFLDRLMEQAGRGELRRELALIYVSPLKSLAADIRENLNRPLDGIYRVAKQEEAERGADQNKTERKAARISVAVRTGDTTQRERQQMLKNPPHILITTPESLYLMLTGQNSRRMLSTARAVIVDELHALIDTKRGAHLMLSLARLDVLCGKPLQRIGLSATIEPLEKAARYLAPDPVVIAAPFMKKETELRVLGPYADVKKRKKDPVWEELAALVFSHCQTSRSVIAFVEGRRYAEKLAYYVNLLGGEDFARVHHGSLSKEQRAETEQALRDGRLRLLCATSSMELGIDVGQIGQVLQVGCPRTISGTMQRLGRAGHNPQRVSRMLLFPRTAGECVTCGMTAQLAGQGGVEQCRPPRLCLDVLAQHLVSMAAVRGYTLDEVMKILPRAWPFENVTREDVKEILEMLAGDYEHDRDIPVRPRVLYDRIHERVEGDGYSRLLALSAGGTIPDRGLYTVKTKEGVKLGEVDEEFVYESRKGDKFLLGAFGWRIEEISRDTVTVTQAPAEGARLPFWKGELKGRDMRTGEAFGRILQNLQRAHEEQALPQALALMGLDETASALARGYLERQIAVTGRLPDHENILMEHFKDQYGNSQLMIHSIFGRRVNAPLALLAAYTAKESLGKNVGSVDEEDGILLYSYGDGMLPEGLLERIDPDRCESLLAAMLPATPLFNIAFRHNCGRALMMGVRKSGRQPLWMQRLRSAEMLDAAVNGQRLHPMIRETRRECMEDLWDVSGLRELLARIHSGQIKVKELYTEIPSPMSLPLQWGQEAAVMYDYTPTPDGVHRAVAEAVGRAAGKISGSIPSAGLPVEGIVPGSGELEDMQGFRRLPENPEQLHSLLMAEGDLAAGELEIPVEWLEQLAREERAVYLEQGLWIAAEQTDAYRAALEEENREERLHLVRRMLRYRGAAGPKETAARYGWSVPEAEEILEQLRESREAELQDGLYYHGELYRRARVKTLQNLRTSIRTCPGEAYAAFLISGCSQREGEVPQERLRELLITWAGCALPAAVWESIFLPGRIGGYRENMLDELLAGGGLSWHMDGKGNLVFTPTEETDWEAELDEPPDLTEKEELVYRALLKRGASFMQSLNGLLPGESPHETLLSLMEKGLVYADSFLPVRQWLNRDKIKRQTVRGRVNARVKALHAGRWDVVRPLKAESVQKQLEICFHRYGIVSRQTAAACGLSWQDALSVLRIWEYTGQARRGYFVEGMSGAQFVRKEDFSGILSALEKPGHAVFWVNGADPALAWGRVLPHKQEGEDRSFLLVPGTAVALDGGLPVAVMERQGRVLRLFGENPEGEKTEELLRQFAADFARGRIYPAQGRIVVKKYPKKAASALSAAGFLREMQDYVLYR